MAEGAAGGVFATERIDIPTEDGRILIGTLFRPPGSPRSAAVLHGATGAPQTSYAAFAAWLAETRGVACLTYDYRDFGASATGSLRASTATMLDWGVTDQNAALDELVRRFGDAAEIWTIGHSLGGLFLGQHRQLDRTRRAIVIASGPAYLHAHPLSYRPTAAAFWYVAGPLTTSVFGYLPGERIGLGASLPAGVYWQWRRWCLSRAFSGPDLEAAGWSPRTDFGGLPIKFVAAEDDPMIPPAVVWRHMQAHPGARRDQLVLRPRDIGAGAIHHLGMFRRRNQAAWSKIIAEPDR